MTEGKVYAVCVSEAKGTPKKEVKEVTLVAGHGIEGDAHAGDWHRQVSLLSEDKVERFRETGIDVDNGAFGENILVTGIDPVTLAIGTKVKIGQSVMEITQIGKECHSHCRIYHTVGDCIMPREGVFAKVLEGGLVKKGDSVHVDG